MVFKYSKVIIVIILLIIVCILSLVGCTKNNTQIIDNPLVTLQAKVDSLNKCIVYNDKLIVAIHNAIDYLDSRIVVLEKTKLKVIKKYDKEITNINIINDSIRDVYRSKFFDNDTTFPKDIDLR